MTQPHVHRDEGGLLIRCYHSCKHWLTPSFLIGWLVVSTITFFPEHALWEKVWPFYALTAWMESLPKAPHWLSGLIDLMWMVAIVYGVINYTKKGRDDGSRR